MKRRDVIKLGAVAAGAGAGVPGCSLPRMLNTLHGADGAAAFNAMLDDQLGHLAKPGFLQRLVEAQRDRPLSAAAHAKIADSDVLFRKMLGTLLITQGFRELPEETQLEPAVQSRMSGHLEQIGTTGFEVSDMLAALGDHERAQVQRTLRSQPELPMKLAEALDVRAERVGISRSRRRQMRGMMSHSSFRMRHGDPGVIIDEYVGKVERLRASTARDGTAIDLAARLGEREFWRYQHLLAAAGAPPAASASGAPSAPSPYPMGPGGPPGLTPAIVPGQPLPSKETVKPERPGSGGLRVGGYMFGIGLVVGLGSAVVISAGSIAGVFGLTLAAVLVGIGLIVLLISALIYAANG